MVRLFVLFSGLFLSHSAALELNPVRAYKELEGFKIAVFTFSDGPRRVSYIPPADWKMSGESAKLTLTPLRTDGALMQLLVEKLNPSQAATRLASETEEKRRQWAKGFLPENAVDATLAVEYPSPFMLGQKQSHEWIFHYLIGKMPYAMSVARVELSDRERLVVLTTAKRAHFNDVRQEAISSMFSWEWISPPASNAAAAAVR